MAFSIDEFTRWLKLPTKYFFALSVATGFLLFGDNTTIQQLGLAATLEAFRPYVGGVFLISFALLLTNVLLSFWNSLRRILNRVRARGYLHNLTPDEKRVLLPFMNENSKTRNLSILDGVAVNLEARGIIYQSSNIGRFHSFPYTVHDWVWKYIHRHPKLISEDQGQLNLLKEKLRRRKRKSL